MRASTKVVGISTVHSTSGWHEKEAAALLRFVGVFHREKLESRPGPAVFKAFRNIDSVFVHRNRATSGARVCQTMFPALSSRHRFQATGTGAFN